MSGDRPLQSVLDTAGPHAAGIAQLTWVLIGVCLAVLALVLMLLFLALLRRRETAGERFVIFWGVGFTGAVLTALLFVAMVPTTRRSGAGRDAEALRVRVVGHQWWWAVEYPGLGIVTANELHLPVGVPVRLELGAEDVVHSFWVPSLHGKMDLVPGHTNELWIEADRPGVFRGQCAEFCGLQHARMALLVVALPREEFAAWAVASSAPASAPADAERARGQQVFFEAACHNCHAIRGTRAEATLGPDLTHIGSRRTLGAGTIPNTPERLSRWIADPQEAKPGARMPPSDLSAEDLQALRRYLESLRS